MYIMPKGYILYTRKYLQKTFKPVFAIVGTEAPLHVSVDEGFLPFLPNHWDSDISFLGSKLYTTLSIYETDCIFSTLADI